MVVNTAYVAYSVGLLVITLLRFIGRGIFYKLYTGKSGGAGGLRSWSDEGWFRLTFAVSFSWKMGFINLLMAFSSSCKNITH